MTMITYPEGYVKPKENRWSARRCGVHFLHAAPGAGPVVSGRPVRAQPLVPPATEMASAPTAARCSAAR